jgi:hypothetical protein
MGFLSDDERAQLSPAEDLPHRGRIVGYDRHAELGRPDRFVKIKEDYLRNGADPSNLRYGYVRRT